MRSALRTTTGLWKTLTLYPSNKSFHALYLPAILLALDLPLPKHILTHGHWTMDRFKMSKSRGNVANPFEAMKLWGVDAMRMYLMRVGGNSAGDAGASAGALFMTAASSYPP